MAADDRPTESARSTRRPAIPVLTTLRFPAAFAIVLYHFLPYTPCPPWVWAGFGSGVSFFYVLSGFILYYTYEHLRDVRYFWLARLARIWPTHLVTLILAFILVPWPDLLGHASWPATLPLNIFLLHAWLPYDGSVLSFNGVSWSLSVEAFFYACFPFLCARLNRRGPLGLLVGSFVAGLAVVGLASLLLPRHASFVGPFNPLCRLFEFVLGMSTCFFWLRVERATARSGEAWSSWEALILLGALCVAIGEPALSNLLGLRQPLWRWFATEISAGMFAVLIWVFAHQRGQLSAWLAVRPLRWLGEISFALYMTHQIIGRFVGMETFAQSTATRATGDFLLYFMLTVAVSAAFYYGVEGPARRLMLAPYPRGSRESAQG
jgi:peptidoglycan/LPS O-acetylase OafA/YrhL